MAATAPIPASDPHVQTSLAFLDLLFGNVHPRDFQVRLWDGTAWGPEEGQPARFTIVLKHPGALRAMFWPPEELTMAEAYIYDDFDIEGDIESVFRLADPLLAKSWTVAEKAVLGRLLLKLPDERMPRAGRQAARVRGRRHSKTRDQQAISYHYDVSNDFYALWLDKNMVYSCAYFHSPEDDLDTAQERKLDYICRKLRLRPGERLLDIGCGWGGLVIHAAQHYGVEALGITLSRPQVEYAQERIRRLGLQDRCRVEFRDYRDVNEPESFDKLVSVGMFEHVGREKLEEYFGQAWRILRPGGVFLNHGIACKEGLPASSRPTFSDRYVFPDGELVPIHVTLEVAEKAGFEVRDVENLREHYMWTLRNWVRRLEAHHDQARALTDEVTYRVWRLFMSGSAHGFKVGRLKVYQALLSKPDADGDSRLPLTRADWYA
ncbi:MAG: class I SAM-dependent methyltransferase [Anaerolineae bacterium]|nr:class I SAM-dependent methyltransferase [Anaerolineae bacterium]